MLLNSNTKKREKFIFSRKNFDRRASEFSHEKIQFELNAREKKANISFVAHENEFQKECGPEWNQFWFVFQILMAVFYQRQFGFSLILTIFETRFDAQKRNVGVFSQAFKWFMYIKIFF